jgi:hypothetical protein
MVAGESSVGLGALLGDNAASFMVAPSLTTKLDEITSPAMHPSLQALPILGGYFAVDSPLKNDPACSDVSNYPAVLPNINR